MTVGNLAKVDRPVGIDLFAGAGGMSLGFEQAGFDISAAVEIDPIHAAVHKFNFPNSAVLCRSVIGLSGDEIKHAAKLGSRPVDVVFGGAPCQGFSLIGQRALDDPRNALVRDFVRIVRELDASYFVFENVKGLTLGRHRRCLEEVIDAFQLAGYRVRMPWRVLNASAYGVPQDRERLILIGAKEGLELPSYPQPITRAAGSTAADLPDGPSCHDALADIPDAEGFTTLWSRDWVRTTTWGLPSSYSHLLRCLDDDGWGFGYRRHWDPSLLTSSLRTAHTSISRRRFAATEPGRVEPISRLFRLPEHGVSHTLRAGTDSARGAFTSPRPIHYSRPRLVTVREMARLHGFPDWFRFHETKWHGARQIGNAVPPALARAVAAEIVRTMGLEPSMPELPVALGGNALLGLDMSRASKFWGIPVPIGKRDRKSGARKRNQEEIEVQESERLAYA
jgi:DNA (cytosine-5)-methyltransferase 1